MNTVYLEWPLLGFGLQNKTLWILKPGDIMLTWEDLLVMGT